MACEPGLYRTAGSACVVGGPQQPSEYPQASPSRVDRYLVDIEPEGPTLVLQHGDDHAGHLPFVFEGDERRLAEQMLQQPWVRWFRKQWLSET